MHLRITNADVVVLFSSFILILYNGALDVIIFHRRNVGTHGKRVALRFISLIVPGSLRDREQRTRLRRLRLGGLGRGRVGERTLNKSREVSGAETSPARPLGESRSRYTRGYRV